MDGADNESRGYSKLLLRDLTVTATLSIDAFLMGYSTPLVLNGRFAGSGTFIKADGRFGILTAHHVLHNPEDPSLVFRFGINSTQRLSLSVMNRRAHSFDVSMSCLRGIDVGIPETKDKGPDLSIIVLPEPLGRNIEDRKFFTDISVKRSEHIRACQATDGLWCAFGFPSHYQKPLEPSAPGKKSTYLPGVTLYTNVSQRSERAIFDFLNLAVDNLSANVGLPPSSFGGMSGGSVWKIPLMLGENGSAPRVECKGALLSGVIYYQARDDKGRLTELYCHGPRSSYEKVYEAIVLNA